VVAATIPNCRAYDPAFAYELAIIMDHGMRRMMGECADEFYYITVMNENYAQPSMPAGVAEQIVKGLYRLPRPAVAVGRPAVQLLGSGAILREVLAAADILIRDFDVASDVFSVTSFSELARDAREVERHNRFNPTAPARRSHIEQCLSAKTPIVAATDYVRAYPELIASHVRARFLALGTDGFGRSDTRAALRDFFEVDRHSIAVAALAELVRERSLDPSVLEAAILRFRIDASRRASWSA
jgi:pyruvate dehydrogenase E1 component